jgi:hypothetical protein
MPTSWAKQSVAASLRDNRLALFICRRNVVSKPHHQIRNNPQKNR